MYTKEILKYWLDTFGLEGFMIFNREEFMHPSGKTLKIELIIPVSEYIDKNPNKD